MINNLYIGTIQGYTAQQRAEAISEELLRISIPIAEQGAASSRVFEVVIHPTTQEAVLIADYDYQIFVHPDNDLTDLIALFPDLSEIEKNGLINYIQGRQLFFFGAIVPSDATLLTNEEMAANGWFEQE
jgi:hypothetical protein